MRLFVALREAPVLALRFSLNYPKQLHIKHVFANSFNFLCDNKLRFFCLRRPLGARMEIGVKIRFDFTDQRYGPVIQPFVGRRINDRTPKTAENRA